jgi:hypothetical protein
LTGNIAILNDVSGTATYGALLADTEPKVILADEVLANRVKDLLVSNKRVFFADANKPQLDGRAGLDAAQQVRSGAFGLRGVFSFDMCKYVQSFNIVERGVSVETQCSATNRIFLSRVEPIGLVLSCAAEDVAINTPAPEAIAITQGIEFVRVVGSYDIVGLCRFACSPQLIGQPEYSLPTIA